MASELLITPVPLFLPTLLENEDDFLYDCLDDA